MIVTAEFNKSLSSTESTDVAQIIAEQFGLQPEEIEVSGAGTPEDMIVTIGAQLTAHQKGNLGTALTNYFARTVSVFDTQDGFTIPN